MLCIDGYLAPAQQWHCRFSLEHRPRTPQVELLAALDKRAALTHGMTRGNLQMEETTARLAAELLVWSGLLQGRCHMTFTGLCKPRCLYTEATVCLAS